MKNMLNCWGSWISCKKYTELASKKLDTNLSFQEKVGFGLHHILCMVCRRFNRQINLIEKALEQESQNECCSHDDRQHLSKEARERIAAELKNHSNLP